MKSESHLRDMEEWHVKDIVEFFEWVYEWETQHGWTPEMLAQALRDGGFGDVPHE